VPKIGIIGLGAMGLASAWAASRRGLNVTGFDRFPRGHNQGSSHGASRMIRRIYSEGALYTPLLDRAFEAWKVLEAEAGQPLFVETGGLDIGTLDSPFLVETLANAEASGEAFDVFDAAELRRRFPAMNVPDDISAVHAPGSGYLLSDKANAAMARLAEARGAALRWDSPVTRIEALRGGFRLHTAQGVHEFDHVILAAGPWAGDFDDGLNRALTVERQVVGLFKGPRGIPPFQRLFPDGRRIYALPNGPGGRWKLGVYHHREQRGPEYRDTFPPDAEDRALLTHALKAVLPDCPPPEAYEVCRFTNTQDHRFIVDTGADGQVRIAACSGHGYKFAPAIGEAAVALALGEAPAVNLSAFTPDGQTKL
jgi:sarcosine oxidase